MEKYELFKNYIDGLLTSSDEEHFFLELNSDYELRNQFRNFIKIENTFKKTATAHIPPPQLTNNIFAQLGFNIPIEINSPKPSATSKFYSKSSFKMLVSSASSILLTLFFTLFIINNNSLLSEDKISKYNNDQLYKMPEITFIENASIKNYDTILRSEFPKTINYNNNSKEININPKLNNLLFETTEIKKRAFEMKNNDDKYNSKREFLELPIFQQNNFTNNIGEFSLEFKNSEMWSLENETISASDSKLKNLLLSINYQYNENIILGANLRNENFFLNYLSKDSVGQLFLYEQNPNFLTIGIFSKYYLANVDNIDIFGKFEIGANQYGIATRGSASIEYFFGDNIKLILEAEISNLLYYHQNKSNISNKIGINYGIIFKL